HRNPPSNHYYCFKLSLLSIIIFSKKIFLSAEVIQGYNSKEQFIFYRLIKINLYGMREKLGIPRQAASAIGQIFFSDEATFHLSGKSMSLDRFFFAEKTVRVRTTLDNIFPGRWI
ncbi:hypothetical protein L9F63_006117, partial [Diploptera punctata]